MERLIKQNINTREEYERIFFQRKGKVIDWFDLKRWNALISKFKGGKLLDLGCLDSLVSILAKAKCPNSEIWAADFLDIIKEWKSPHINYTQQDAYGTDFEAEYFDYVVIGELIEHMEDPERLIKEAFRITNKGGIVVLSTPLEEAIEPGAVDGERHLWSFTESDLRAMLKPYGKTSVKVLGSQWFPEYKYAFKTIITFTTKIR